MAKNSQFKYLNIKKTHQSINKFQYYLHDLYPDLFSLSLSHLCPNQPMLQSAKGHNDILYFYAGQKVEGDFIFNSNSIIETGKKVYLDTSSFGKEISKINESSYKKESEVKHNLWPVGRVVKEILTFHLVSGGGDGEKEQKKKLSFNPSFQLYVIHHCHEGKEGESNTLIWLNFIEKYSFKQNQIKYEMVGSVKDEKTLLWKNTNTSLFQEYLRKHSAAEMFDKVQGVLLQYENMVKKEMKEETETVFGEEHSLVKKIPEEFLKHFYVLRKMFPDEKQNTISRFFIAKEFDFEETKANLLDYFEWRKEIQQKYTWQDFEDFHQRQIFTYLGEDYAGRPVILNKAANVKVNEMDNQKYCIFYTYYLQIFLQTKMKGNVSQVLIVADLQDIGYDNFKLAITRKNISDCLKFGPQRQYKLIAINAGAFPHYCWNFIKPLLPKKTQSKVVVPGVSEEEILSTLKDEMDVSVIPSYLGGGNTIC